MAETPRRLPGEGPRIGWGPVSASELRAAGGPGVCPGPACLSQTPGRAWPGAQPRVSPFQVLSIGRLDEAPPNLGNESQPVVLRAEAVHTVAQGLIGCLPEASASGPNSALMYVSGLPGAFCLGPPTCTLYLSKLPKL